MEFIQSSFTFSSLSISQTTYNQRQPASDAGFDAVLAGFTRKGEECDCHHSEGYLDGGRVFDFINRLFDQVQGSFDSSAKAIELQLSPKFPFSAEFSNTFGVTGPLPSYINRITVELGLSQEKNLSLQNIAINNQNATRSEESIAKIREELKAAGISR